MDLERYREIKPLNATYSPNASELYEATDSYTRKIVVIKTQSRIASSDPRRREQFQYEIAIARKLDHPCILPLIDSGQGVFHSGLPPVPFLVYPFIPNGSLAKLLIQRPYCVPWSLLQTARVILQLGSALSYVHQLSQPLVHRDLRPDNFLVQLMKGSAAIERVFLCDFGIALELTAQRGSEKPQGKGTYMAPEQFKSGGTVCQSDQYVLAFIACYLLTGKYPLEPLHERTWEGWREAHTYLSPTTPSQIDPECFSPKIDEVLLKAMQKKPEQRFTTVWNFAYRLYLAIKERTGEVLPEALLAEMAPG